LSRGAQTLWVVIGEGKHPRRELPEIAGVGEKRRADFLRSLESDLAELRRHDRVAPA